MPQDDQNARKAAAQVLRGWKQAGVDFLPATGDSSFPKLSAKPTELVEKSLVSTVPEREATSPPYATYERVATEMPQAKKSNSELPRLDESTLIWPDLQQQRSEDRTSALNTIRKEVTGCTLCKELANCRTQTVFGVGSITPRLCFFGEAPGADEDRQGEPFVGRAGQLLDKIIEAMTLKREDVYILNTLKCRPPGNRTPLPEEVENCRPYFTRQLEILRPEFIVCLGACAAQALLRTKEAIGKLRGRAQDYRGIRVYATYHPAYLLRNPPAKRDVWDDMKVVMKEMGLAIPKS